VVLRLVLLCALAPGLIAQRPDFEALVLDDSSGNPLPSAEARLQRAGQRELAADLDTDREGVARASGLAPGEYTLKVSKPNYVAAQVRVTLPAARVTVRLVHFGILSGMVTDAKGHPAPGRISAPYGRTIGGARVQILTKAEGAGGLKIFREVNLDDDGRYRVYDLPPGQYAVGLWYDGLADGSGMMLYPDIVRPRWFTIGGGEEHNGIDFQVPTRPVVSVSGRVVLPKPKTRFALALGLPEQPLLPIAQTITEDDGTFKFERVPAGMYDLFVAGPDGGYTARASVIGGNPFYGRTRISVGATPITGLELTVAPGRSVAVTLRPEKPPEGCPASLAIRARPAEPWGVEPLDAQVLTFGKESTMIELPPGPVRFEPANLPANCYAASLPIAEAGAAAVTLEFATAGSLRGLLRGAPKPQEHTVVLLDVDGVEARVATPDANGRFTIDGLKPGAYRIAARPRGRWVTDPSKMVEIQIPGGSPTEIELPAQKGDRP
jgi:hypothetical protein